MIRSEASGKAKTNRPPLLPSSHGSSSYRRLLDRLATNGLHRQGKQLHAHFILSSLTPDNLFASKLIYLYSLINNLPQARHLFDQIPQKNVFSFNRLFSAYLRNDLLPQALSLFSSSLSSSTIIPNSCTISCLLKALSSSSSSSSSSASSYTSSYSYTGKEAHAFALRNMLEDDVFVGNGLICLYSKCGSFHLARTVFNFMKVKDIVSWNSMMSGYSHGGLHRECKELYTQLVSSSSGLKPNAMTITGVLHSCARSKDLLMGMEVHRSISLYLKEVDILTCNSLLGLYAKCGDLPYAEWMLQEMKVRDDVSYCTLISGYMLHGFVEKGVEIFMGVKNPGLNVWNSVISGLFQNKLYQKTLQFITSMQDSGGMRYNSVTLCIIIPVFSHFLNLKGCKAAHGYSVRNNCGGDVYFVSATIDAYSKLGFLKGAELIFSQSRDRSLVIWTAMIAAFASHGCASMAISHFEEMLREGVRPDGVTFVAVLSACAHSGMVDTSFHIFDSMGIRFGVPPSVEHYACMVEVLTRAGRLSEALDFISKLPVKPSAEIWGSLFNGASASCDPGLGRFVFDQLFEMEPGNGGNYVAMSNLYSQAERWDEADMVREKMKKMGMKKPGGISFIDPGVVVGEVDHWLKPVTHSG